MKPVDNVLAIKKTTKICFSFLEEDGEETDRQTETQKERQTDRERK